MLTNPFMLSVIVLSVDMLSVVILSVVTPESETKYHTVLLVKCEVVNINIFTDVL